MALGASLSSVLCQHALLECLWQAMLQRRESSSGEEVPGQGHKTGKAILTLNHMGKWMEADCQALPQACEILRSYCAMGFHE